MEWLADPTAWMGLATLVVLEIILGIDNLVFIAILASRLPPQQRNRARVIGLSLALLMRLGLLAGVSWLVTLTRPLVELFGHPFSGRDLILLGGGLFLLFKGTAELHQQIEGGHELGETRMQAGFWAVVAQIVVLDAVFSIDAVITAVGMVEHLSVMMLAVIIAIGVMLFASKPLTAFVITHPTVVILCLGFLLMIGFSLVAEGFGFHIPKGYLYAAIGFSLLIEGLNQTALYKQMRRARNRPLRERTAEAVLKLLGGQPAPAQLGDETSVLAEDAGPATFTEDERVMIGRVLKLAERPAASLMTPRHELTLLDLDRSRDALVRTLLQAPHSRLVAIRGGAADEPLGIVQKQDLLAQLLSGSELDPAEAVRQPLIFPETVSVLSALDQFRQTANHFAFIVTEFGTLEGVVTLTDVMEAIAGSIPEAHEVSEAPEVERLEDGGLRVDGGLPMEELRNHLPLEPLPSNDFHTVAGLVLHRLDRIPEVGDRVTIDGWEFTVTDLEGLRIEQVEIHPVTAEEGGEE